MRKIITLILISICYLQASNHKTIEASYDVSYGVFGKLGVANTVVNIDHNTYSIKIVAKATGLAKSFSNGKEEIYTSTGIIDNDTFIPKTFTKHAKSNTKIRIKKYTFDYENNKVHLESSTSRLITLDTEDDSDLMGGSSDVQTTWKKEESKETLDYFASNDLLSLFFNIKQFVPNFNQGENYTLNAIGASKDKGKIDIVIPSGKKFEDLEKSLDVDDSKKFIAYINQRIFSSKRGELFISLNDYGICNKAVLKDVLLFGDIVGEMTNFKVKES